MRSSGTNVQQDCTNSIGVIDAAPSPAAPPPAPRSRKGLSIFLKLLALIVSLILAAAVFLLLPLGLYFATGDAQALWIMLGGLLLFLPAARLVGPNRPRSYNPRQPPDLLH